MAAEEPSKTNHILIYCKLDRQNTGKIIYEAIKDLKNVDESYKDVKQIYTTYYQQGGNTHSSKLTKTSYENIFKLSYEIDQKNLKSNPIAITNIEADLLDKLSKDERLFKYSTMEEKNLKIIFELDADEKAFHDKITSSSELQPNDVQDPCKDETEDDTKPKSNSVENDSQSNTGDISSVSGTDLSCEVFIEAVLNKELYDDIIKSMSANKKFNKNFKFANVKDMRLKFVGLIVENVKEKFDLYARGIFFNFLRFRMNDSDNKIILPISKDIADYICKQSLATPYQFKCTSPSDNKTTIYEITFTDSNLESYNQCKFKFKNFENKSADILRQSSQKSVASSSKTSQSSFKVSRSFTNLQSMYDSGKITDEFYTQKLNQMNDDGNISDSDYTKEILKIQSVVS